MKYVSVTDVLEMCKHDGFEIYNNMIELKIQDYMNDLCKFDAKLSKVQYSEKDVIAKQIESLREIKDAPIAYLMDIQAQSEEDVTLIQRIIDNIKKTINRIF